MKLTVALSFLCIYMFAANNSYAQTTLLSLRVENKSLREVFSEIEKNSEYIFFYYDDIVDLDRKVNIRMEKQTINQILDRLFAFSDNAYTVDDRQITITRKDLISPDLAQQARKRIQGKIRDKEGEPVIGATILEAKTTNAVISDVNGDYSILLTQPASELVVSFVGYQSRRTKVGDESVINILLEQDTRQLDDVVVVGYGVQKKENLTGAISTVGSEVLGNRPNYNIAQSLQGVMPNVNVSFGDGKPGRQADINIRGLSVITGNGSFESTSPYILIDGVPGDLNSVNPSDVQSVTVLKDAASASIYGARGAYGVMLITTKNGKAGEKPQVNASFNYSVSRPLSSYDMVTDPYTFMKIKNEAWTGYNNTTLYSQERLDYAKALEKDPSLPRTVVGPGGEYQYYYENNWYDKMYNKQTPKIQANASLRGGSEKMRYYLSLGYVSQEGVFVRNPDEYKKYNINAKMTLTPNKYIEIYNYTDGVRSDYDYPTWFGNDVNVWRYMQVVPTTTLSPEFNPDGTRTRETFFLGYLEEGGRGKREDLNVRNTTGFNISPMVEGLHLRGDFTYSYSGYDRNDRFKRVKTSLKEGDNSYYLGRNSVKQSRYYANNYVLNLYADYERQFGLHQMKGLVGFNNEFMATNDWWAQRDNVIGDQLSSLNLANGTMTMGQGKEEYAVRGYFFRVNYNYADRYLLEVNGRYDMSSRFPKETRGGFFPSASAAWRVGQEAFMESTAGWLSDLKLRASYGTLGNQQIANFAFVEKMSTYQIAQIIGSERPLAVSVPNPLPNRPTWEKSSTFDAGLDLVLLDQKLVFGFDYYVTDITDMLTKGKTQPAVFGATEPKENAADLRTKGWDLPLSFTDRHDLLGSPFGYRVSFNMGDNKTKVTAFDNPSKLTSQFYVGQELGEIWGLETEGLFQQGDELNAVDQTLFEQPAYTRTYGDLKWKDQDGDNRISRGSGTVENPGDFVRIGNSLPRYNYGFSFHFDWYGFDVDALFQGIGKRDYYPGGEASYFWSVYNRPANSVASHLVGNYWTEENPNAYFPRMRGYLAMANNRAMGVPQTRFLQDASYLRFKNLTIGYTIPRSLTEKFFVSRLNVYFSAENILTFTNLHKSMDPEAISKDPDTQSNWGDGLSYPMARTFSFGLNLNF